ncbi:MAG: hypothetical protein VCD00_00980, partial [Candidatus Hydrogenedentota bacterium]
CIPFFVAPPYSTLDLSITVPKSQLNHAFPKRSHTVSDHKPPPNGVKVSSPTFDVTPAKIITGNITEKGIFSSLLNYSIAIEQGAPTNPNPE